VLAAAVLAANLLGASCSRKGPGPIVAPADPAQGLFPLWAAVSSSSTYAVHLNGKVALEIPVLRMGADLLRQRAGDAGLDYEGLVDALGFEPILDIEEVFITDAGPAHPGGGRRRQVIVMRYAKDVGNLDVVLKLVGATGGLAVDRRQIVGRSVFFIEDHALAVAALDATSVVLLRRFGPADVEPWLAEATEPCEVRERAYADVGERADDPHLGPPERRFFSAWVDAAGLVDRLGRSGSVPETIQPPLPLEDLQRLVESADTVVVHASYSGSIAVLQQVGFTNQESARVSAELFLELGQRLARGESLPLVGGLLGKIAATFEVQVEGNDALARWEVPEDVLEAATALVGLFVGMAQTMKEGPPPGLPFPILPRHPEQPPGI
jgi:hypothetical protein